MKLLALRLAKDFDWFAECLSRKKAAPKFLPQNKARLPAVPTNNRDSLHGRV
jgi:hypothetical protein